MRLFKTHILFLYFYKGNASRQHSGNVWVSFAPLWINQARWLSCHLQVSFFFGVIVSFSGPGRAQASGPSEQVLQAIDYEKFMDLVSKSHPERTLDQISLGVIKAREKKGVRLPDPQISITAEDFPLALIGKKDMDSMTSGEASQDRASSAKWTLSLTQAFPWPGTFVRESQKAEVTRQKKELTLQEEQVRRLFAARILFIDLEIFNSLLRIENENLREAEQILKSAQTRFQYGVGSHHDTIEAHHENVLLRLAIEAMGENLEALKDRAAEMIGQIVGHETAGRVEFVLDGQALRGAKGSVLSRQVPPVDLMRSQLSVDQGLAREKKEVESLRSAPSIMAGGMLMRSQDGSMNSFGLMVGMSVPLFAGSFREGVSEEFQAEMQEIETKQTYYERQKKRALRTLERREKVAKAQLQGLKNDIVPSALEHLRTVASEYAIGKSPFATVNRARRQLLKFQEAKVYAERELVLLDVARERIGYGLLDLDLNALMPQIASGDSMGVSDRMGDSAVGGGGMAPGAGMGSEGWGNGMNNSSAPSRPGGSGLRRRPTLEPSMEEEGAKSQNKGSMGDM